MMNILKRRAASGLAITGLLMGGGLLSGCSALPGLNPPHTPDAVVGNQGTKNSFITGAKTDGAGRVTANPSTGGGGRRHLSN